MIHEILISGDKKYLLVWHQDGARRKISVYSTDHPRLISRFSPGFGGSLAWTKNNYIYHEWGCGTNCLNVAVYDPTGAKLFTKSCGGADLSPTFEYVVLFSSIPIDRSDLAVYKFAGLSLVHKYNAYEKEMAIRDVNWLNSHKLRLELKNNKGVTVFKTIDISQY